METEANIRSPFTGGKVKEVATTEEQEFRKEVYTVHARYYICEDTGEKFSTTSQDEIMFGDLYSQYRIKHGIPFPGEIRSMRQRYGLNYVQMSKILGFGPNQYAQYENGQIPSDSNGRILAAVRNKQSMLMFLENARNELGEKEYLALKKSISSSEEKDQDWRTPLLFQGTYKSLSNGYVTPSVEKLEQFVRFFVSREGSVFPTKLSKELFYADFLHFKHHGQGISGLQYKAVQHGPVPAHYNTIYDNIEGLESETVLYRGMECSKFSCDGFNDSFFSKDELATLETVVSKCVQMTASEIISASRNEPAWKNSRSSRDSIPYSEAYDLKLF